MDISNSKGVPNRWIQLVIGIICMGLVANLQYAWTLFVTPAGAIAIVNPSFESPDLGAGGYGYQPAGATWTFSAGAGIAGTGSPWIAGSPPDGNQAAFMQATGSWSATISQILTGFTIGDSYSVTFWSPYIADPAASLVRTVQVTAGAPASADLQLTRDLHARPEPRPRRADWVY